MPPGKMVAQYNDADGRSKDEMQRLNGQDCSIPVIQTSRLPNLEFTRFTPILQALHIDLWCDRPKTASVSQRVKWNMAKSPIYKIIFFNQGQIFEIFAKQIFQSELYGFVEVEDFVFGERSQMLVDPSEEKLKAEFEGVKRSYIPMHAVVRIDEVDKEGVGKISEPKGGSVSSFPVPLFNPSGGKKE